MCVYVCVGVCVYVCVCVCVWVVVVVGWWGGAGGWGELRIILSDVSFVSSFLLLCTFVMGQLKKSTKLKKTAGGILSASITLTERGGHVTARWGTCDNTSGGSEHVTARRGRL